MPTKTNTSPSKDHHGANRGLSDTELQRKRARDRKSQQAMRNRIKWSMDGLTEHVAHLTKALEQETWQNSHCQRRIFALEQENVQLRADNAALQLSLQSDVTGGDHPSALSLNFSDLEKLPSWHTLPLNIPPTCLSDQIFQGCLGAQLQDLQVEKNTNPKPDLTRLIDDSARCGTNANNIILDIVKSYTEIDSLPKQVGVHFVMFRLLRWMLLQDEQSWNQMPTWLRPVPEQLTTAHASWVDRIPWPQARRYLIGHPEIQLDDFALVYSSSFEISWTYSSTLVLITLDSMGGHPSQMVMNPVYEEHITQLCNWKVGEAFRNRFPELAQIIDDDCWLNQPGQA